MSTDARKVGRSYKQERPEGRWDAIVIGSGMGGLTAAALLARHGGRRVLVLERHATAGGFTHTFRRPGFEWDLVALEWWLADHPRLVTFGRQGLFVPDNTHHALAMADAAAGALAADGTFDHDAWARSRAAFRHHVVED